MPYQATAGWPRNTDTGAVVNPSIDADYLAWIAAGNTLAAADFTAEIEAAKAQVRVVREAMLNRLAGIALAASLSGDTATTAAYIVARQDLLDITENLPAKLPEVVAEIGARYNAIAETARFTSPTLANAFAGVDA